MPEEVYPRVCGVTGSLHEAFDGTLGLSPRVRGHHVGAAGKARVTRSIPACAGSPVESGHNR